MNQVEMSKQILLGYSRMLEYPREDTPEIALELRDTLNLVNPEISQVMRGFPEFFDDKPFSKLEEIYSSTFDISPTCYIYAGYQIFGEGFKRSEFIIGLKEKFREYNFEWGNELPDHFSILVKFLAEIELFEDTAKAMINDCLLPSLSKMLKSMTLLNKEVQNPYWYILQSLETYLISCVEEFKQKEEA